jgi:hypothetical protein
MNQESTSRLRERVYFIEAVGLDLVKIGYTADLTERLRKLAPGCPAPLRLLGTVPGGLLIERHYHERLNACRARGEWFHKSPALDAILATLDAPQPRSKKSTLKALKISDAAYEANCTRLFQEWDERKKMKADARATKKATAMAPRETAEQIAARL